jgi:hypothetical protein
MSEYCEYMWCDPARGHNSTALVRSIYEEGGRFDKRDKKLAIKTVRAILREMPDVGKKLYMQSAFTLIYRFRRTFMKKNLNIYYIYCSCQC